jgi:tetratricopeptide (TPR) repeat protein
VNRLAQYLVGGLAAALLIAWGTQQLRSALALNAQAELLADPVARLSMLPSESLSGENSVRLSDMYEREIIPPNYAHASASLGGALVHFGGHSQLWIRLARIRLFQGEPEQSRAALERAERLDPFLPAARLESISLWYLLGEPERAERLAREIGDLDLTLFLQAAEHLRFTGNAPEEIYRILGGRDIPVEQLRRLLPLLRSRNAASTARLVRALEPTHLEDAEIVRSAAKFASDPLEPESLSLLWRQRDPGVAQHHRIPNMLVPSLPLASGGLPITDFALGWGSPVDTQGVELAYFDRPKDIDTTATVALRLRFDDEALRPSKDGFRWQVLSLLVPPKADPIVVVSVQNEAPELSEASVRLTAPNLNLSVPLERLRSDWQTFRLQVRPADFWRVARLQVNRQPSSRVASSSARLNIAIESIE